MRGSEHTIAGIQFPGELQFNFFNSQLYASYDEAQNKAHGLAVVAAMIQMAEVSGKAPNAELKKLIHTVQNITSKGRLKIKEISLWNFHDRSCLREDRGRPDSGSKWPATTIEATKDWKFITDR